VSEERLHRDTEMFGHMDPFLMFKVNKKEYKTKVLHEAGKNPHWMEHIEIPVDSWDDEVRMICFDEDFLMNDCIGEATYSVGRICEKVDEVQTFPLMYKRRKAAEILITVNITI
jgi:Ca2+-dependent lipid-binding protein